MVGIIEDCLHGCEHRFLALHAFDHEILQRSAVMKKGGNCLNIFSRKGHDGSSIVWHALKK